MSSEAPDPRAPSTGGPRPDLERAILVALDRLLQALELEPLGADRFRATSEPGRFADRVFGGQLLAQALRAASHTVDGKTPHSLHAYFAEAGTAGDPLTLEVERVRDGRSISTRRVTIAQGERRLLIAITSFHQGPTRPELAESLAPAPPPEALPVLQDWVDALPAPMRPMGLPWIEQPPPLELRIGEAPNFLGGSVAEGPRVHWLRVPRDVGDDPLLHSALLAYASDYFLMDMILRSHPERLATGPFVGFSLDHAVWFHRPPRLEGWHRYTQQTRALSGHRGLVEGVLHDAEGHRVATVMQENLVRGTRPADTTE